VVVVVVVGFLFVFLHFGAAEACLYEVLGYVCVPLSMCILRSYAWYCHTSTLHIYAHEHYHLSCTTVELSQVFNRLLWQLRQKSED
jgi:hypothetical protein